MSGSLVKGLVLAAVGLLVLGNVDNVVRPLLLSGSARMNTLVLIISLLGGVRAFASSGSCSGGGGRGRAHRARRELRAGARGARSRDSGHSLAPARCRRGGAPGRRPSAFRLRAGPVRPERRRDLEMNSGVSEASAATRTPPSGDIVTVMQVEGLTVESSPPPFPIYANPTEDLLRAHATSADRDPTVAHILAVLSGYAYADTATVATMATASGWRERVRAGRQAVDAMLIFSTAYLLQSPCGRVAVLCYRGTELANLANCSGTQTSARTPSISAACG